MNGSTNHPANSAMSINSNVNLTIGVDPNTLGFLAEFLNKFSGKLDQLQQGLDKIMSALDDAVTAIQTEISTLSTDMNAAFTALEAAVAAGNPADVASAVTALGAVNTNLQSLDAASLAASATLTPVVTPSSATRPGGTSGVSAAYKAAPPKK